MKAFEKTLAETCGVNAALLFSHIKYWTEQNMKEGRNIRNGKAWMYDTLKHFHELFPFMSRQTLCRTLNKLVGHGFILKGNFNKTTYDRTTWYALTDKGQSLCASETESKAEKPQNVAFPENGKTSVSKRENECIRTGKGSKQNETPIPKEKTDKEQNINQNIIFSDDVEKESSPSANPFLDEAKAVLERLGKRREPSQQELSLYSVWRRQYYMSHEVILAACELTCGANEPSFSYLSRVLDTLHSEHICDIKEYEFYKREKERHERFCDELFARMGESRKPSFNQRMRIKQFTDEYHLNRDILNMCADRAKEKAAPFEFFCKAAGMIRSAGITELSEARDFTDRIINEKNVKSIGCDSQGGYMRHRYTAEELARVCVNLDED